MKTAIAVSLLVPALALAKSPFDGTWKSRLDTLKFEGKPDVYELNQGVYSCASCVPAYKIKADGTEQPVPGHDYVDKESVKVTGPNSVEFADRKGGKLISQVTLTVSADGQRLDGRFTNYVGEKPFSGTFSEKRVAAGSAGAHALSGSWMTDKISDMSDVARTVTLQSTTDGLTMLWNGQRTDARFDGKEYPTQGDPGKTKVSLKKISDHEFEETDRRRGKVTDVVVWTVSADGRTITNVDTDPRHGTKTTITMERQP